MSRGLAFYIGRRLATLCALVVLISFLIFSLLYISPGNPVDTLLGANQRTPETVAQLQEKFHLNEPFLSQYWIWAKGALQLQFGDSIQTSLPVTDEIGRRVGTTLFLGVYAFLLTIVFGVGLGVVAASRKGRALDRGIVAGAIVGLSTPAFVSGIGLLYLFGITLGWFPILGAGSGLGGRLWHLTLPAVALALFTIGFVLKHTRASTISVLDQDYVTFARARGVPPSRIAIRYVLRNALIPVVTILGLTLGFLIVGTVFVEAIFSLAGIGGLLVQSAVNKDLPMLQGVGMLVAVVIMVVNLLTDLVYLTVDPRIRLGRRAA